MAGELIGALRVTLGLDSAQFEAGSKRARQRAQTDAKAIQKALDGIKGRIDAAAGIFGAAELLQAGKRALDYASSLGEVAQQLGVTTKELQEYRYAASQVGISNEEMDTALQKLTRTIGEAKAGSKAQATTFRELGVAIQDANGRVYTAGELIPRIADALSKIKDPATRARIEVDLFGRAGQKLDTMLAGGSQAVNELRDAAQKLGIVLSDRQIQSADETADKLSALKQVLEARIAGTVADNANAILGLANAVATLSARAMQFVSDYPRLAAALAGAAVGARMGGAPGAAIGAGIGAIGGDFAKGASNDANMDLRFRRQQLNEARMELRARRDTSKSGSIISFRKAGSNTKGGTVETQMAEVRRQMGLMQQAIDANRAGRTPALPVVPDGDLPTVASTAGGRTRKASGPTAAEIEQKHNQELSRIRQEQLQAELDLTTGAEERADLQSQLLTEEFNERRAQIDNDEHFTKAQKDAQVALLKALYGVSGEGDNMVVGGGKNSLAAGIARERDERLAKDAYDLKVAQIGADQEALQGQLNMARTAEERRRLSLELLELEYQLRAVKLDQIINSKESSQAERDIAQLQKDRLAGLKAIDVANINQQNLGPMGSYLNSLPQSIEELNEALESVAVRGIQSVEDGLMSIIDGTKSVGEAFRDMAKSIISDLLRIAIQQSITMPLANLLGIGGSVGNMMGPSMSGGGGLFGALLGLGKMFAGSVGGGGGGAGPIMGGAVKNFRMPSLIPGMANGGTIGGFPGIDKNILSINGIPRVRVSANERIRVEPNNDNSWGRAAAKAVHIGQMVFPNVTSGREAREAGRQAASALQAKLAAAKRQGF